METLHGKASAPSAGERGLGPLRPQDKTQGKDAAFSKHSDWEVSCSDTGVISTCVEGFLLQHLKSNT